MEDLLNKFDKLSVIQDCVEEIDWLQNEHATGMMAFNKESLSNWLCSGRTGEQYAFVEKAKANELNALHLAGIKFSEKNKKKINKKMNSFELLGKHFFSSRSALKFANLDALMHFTEPTSSKTGDSLLSAGESLSHAINCDSDCGMIEYMQWRKGRHAHCYSFGNYLKPWSHALPDTKSTYTTHISCGDVSKPNNPQDIATFINFVRQREPSGVHLSISDVMRADKLPVIREDHVKYMVLSYCTLCLAVLRENGTMIVKIMETFSPFTVGLLYLLRRCFRQMAIFKMNFSRPNSSERYLLLRERLPNVDAIVNHLLSINRQTPRPTQLVPIDVIRADVAFDRYIRKHNQELADKQIVFLRERNPFLVSGKCPKPPAIDLQVRVRNEALRLWNLPDLDEITDPKVYFNRHIKNHSISAIQPINVSLIKKETDSWYYVPVTDQSLVTLFMSMGPNRVLMMVDNVWKAVPDGVSIPLPTGCCVYGELGQEYVYEDSDINLGNPNVLHVIDVLFVNCRYINREKPRRIRQQILRKFLGDCDYWKIRYRNVYPVNNICSDINLNFMTNVKDEIFCRSVFQKYYKVSAFLFYKDSSELNSIIPYVWKTPTVDVSKLCTAVEKLLLGVEQVTIKTDKSA